jgi:hypothetical protein
VVLLLDVGYHFLELVFEGAESRIDEVVRVFGVFVWYELELYVACGDQAVYFLAGLVVGDEGRV